MFLTNNQSLVLGQREFRQLRGRMTLIEQTLRHLAAYLKEAGSTRGNSRSDRPQNSRSVENIAAVAANVQHNP